MRGDGKKQSGTLRLAHLGHMAAREAVEKVHTKTVKKDACVRVQKGTKGERREKVALHFPKQV